MKFNWKVCIPVILLIAGSALAVSQDISIHVPADLTDGVEFSVKRGFYTAGFQLALSTTTPQATIKYTLDGSKPAPTNGIVYTEPLTINTNSMVRAGTFLSGQSISKIKTHTYIFPDQVVRQENNMLRDYGFDYSEAETGKVFWTEEMDPEVVNDPRYQVDVLTGLKDIPTLSVVMKKEDLWGPNGIHWGSNLDNTTDAFERECSVEMIYPDGYQGDIYNSWQENCGIKIQGGGGRWDDGTYDHKQSFTLSFKNIYGAGKLKNEIFADAPHGKESLRGMYDRIILRSGHNKGWGSTWDREKTVYTRDQLGRDLQILMSGFGSHGTFVHLYLNGKYWGLYNPCERPDEDFLANNFGGESEDYFYAKGKEPEASDDRVGEAGQSKARFYEACSRDYSQMPYDEMQQWVMADKSIACFLVYGYANPGDGPQYYYGNNNNPAGPVVWIPWDVEDAFGGGSRRTGDPNVSNMIKYKTKGDNGFTAFWKNPDFRMRFSDLVYKYFFNDGVMTDTRVTAAWDKLTGYINKAIVCESARWGDERGTLMDRDEEWNAARLAVRADLQGRAADFVSKLKSAGYFSTLSAPKFWSDDAGLEVSTVSFSGGLELKITREGTVGELYYTTDNSDPRTRDLKGNISNNAIKADGSAVSLNITTSTTVRSRVKNGNEWSPLHEIALIRNEFSAIENAVADQQVICFPNPFTNRLFLSESSDYSLYNHAGLLLRSGHGSVLDLPDLPRGVYLIEIKGKIFKVIKTK